MNTIEIYRNMNHVRHFPIFHTPEASAALADLSCARSVVSGLRSPRWWDIIDLVGTSSVGLATGVHSSCLKHVAESYLMLFKFAHRLMMILE